MQFGDGRGKSAVRAHLLEASYWQRLLAQAQSGLLDFVTIEDTLTIQSSDRSGQHPRAAG